MKKGQRFASENFTDWKCRSGGCVCTQVWGPFGTWSGALSGLGWCAFATFQGCFQKHTGHTESQGTSIAQAKKNKVSSLLTFAHLSGIGNKKKGRVHQTGSPFFAAMNLLFVCCHRGAGFEAGADLQNGDTDLSTDLERFLARRRMNHHPVLSVITLNLLPSTWSTSSSK